MPISLRGKVFAAFLLVAGVMGGVTIVAVGLLNEQNRAMVLADDRQDRLVEALSDLRSTPFEAEGLVMNHLHAHEADSKSAFAADLLGVDTREALALSTLSDLAQGEERGLVADLKLQARQAADLRQRILAISARNALGQATSLATRQMPPLREEVTRALRDLGSQGGETLAAAQAEAALNAMAAAQKNAILNPEPGFVTGQLAAMALARTDFQAALATLQARPQPDLAPLLGQVEALQALDAQMADLLRDSGYDTAETLYALQLRPLDEARLRSLDSLVTLIQASRRMADEAGQARLAQGQLVLVLVADLALILGFGVMVLALSRIGRGLEGAVQLAERMAQSEAAPPTWVEATLSGRLTAALVQISAGQSAVQASLEAVVAGRPLRQELPHRLRERFGTVAALISPEAVRMHAGLSKAREAATALQSTLREGQRDAEALRDGAEGIVTALGPEPSAPADLAAHQVLVAERQVATLIQATQEAASLAEGLSAAPVVPVGGLRRIA